MSLVRRIDIPTLVLCGREDAWATATSHEEMARLIPRSRLIIVPTCGHMSTLEKPDAVTTAMREWLTDIQPRCGRVVVVDHGHSAERRHRTRH